MIDPIFRSDNYQVARKLLDAAVLRHEALAANIANAETPGFRRLDVAPDFQIQLRTRLSADSAGRDLASLRPRVTEDAAAGRTRPDGSNVELDRELLAMNRNLVEHDFISEVISTNLKQLRVAITGRTTG